MKLFNATYIILATAFIASPSYAQPSDHQASSHKTQDGTAGGVRISHNTFQARQGIQNTGEVRSSRPAESLQSGNQYASHPDINPYDRSQVERLQVDMHLDN